MVIIRQLERNDIINKKFDFDLIKKYSFVAIDNDIIIGRILIQRPLIIEFTINLDQSYENIGKLLLINALSKLQNLSIDIVINIDDHNKKIYIWKYLNLK